MLVSTNGHSYIFRYESGCERELYFALIDCARDPDSELGWPEVLIAMEHIGAFPVNLPPQR